MTKADLIESLSDKLGAVKIDAERVVDGVLDAIVEALKQGDPVNISGFGKFAVSMRKARPGRNPKTREAIEISAGRSAKFKLGKQLKDSLNARVRRAPGSPHRTETARREEGEKGSEYAQPARVLARFSDHETSPRRYRYTHDFVGRG